MPTIADAELVAVNTDGYAIFGRKMYLLTNNEIEKIRIYAQMYPDFVEASIFKNEATLEKPEKNKV